MLRLLPAWGAPRPSTGITTQASAPLAAALIVIVACAMFVGLHHPIQDNNEGLYARIALEMLHAQSWVIPTIDGVPYMEKPPLMYWITAASFRIFGTGEAAARLAPMAGFALMLAAIFVFARRWWGERAAILATCVAASCPLVTVMARMLMFDMLFTGLYSWAVFAMYEGVARRGGRSWVRVGYAALALAVLTKGLIALVFYAALALAAVLDPRTGRRERLHAALDGVGVAIFLAIAVPWHLAAALVEPSFLWFYFMNEHVLRFLGLRVPHDYYGGAVWYYVPRLLVAAAPWIFVLATPASRRGEPQGALRRFLWIAFLVPFAFFSASGAKANYYIVVVLPPLALLIARRLDRVRSGRALLVVPAGWAVFFCALGVAGSRLAGDTHLPAAAPAAVALALAMCGVSSIAFLRERVVAGVVAAAAVAIPLALLFSGYLDANRGQNCARELAAEIQRRGVKQVFVFRDYETMSSLGYYLDQPIGIIDSASNDLWYGLHLRPDARRFPSAERFAADARYRGTAVLVARSRERELLKSALGSRLEPVARFGRATLFIRR